MAKILIVDDDETILTILRLNLQKEKHEIIELNDGSNVLNLLASEAPDLLVIDIYMPNQDGLETLIKIRKVMTDLPIIVISGGNWIDQSGSMLEIALEMGANATLKKPIDMHKLLSLVDELTN